MPLSLHDASPPARCCLLPQMRRRGTECSAAQPSTGRHLSRKPFLQCYHASCAVPGAEGGRASSDSVQSAGVQSVSTTRSRRSSFALERASFDANRSSLEMFGKRRNSTSSCPSMDLAQVLPAPVSALNNSR